MTSGFPVVEYSAKTSYDYDQAAGYEKLRFSGPLGKYRWRREQNAVGKLVEQIPQGSTVLDCPCGMGRWWPMLLTRASSIIAMDVSAGMLERAGERPEVTDGRVKLMLGDAENISLDDGSVDFVFSHALTKHLPWPVQYRVLEEFARVANKGVICSFSVLTPLKYRIWRQRNIVESYPFIEEELFKMAEWSGLDLVEMHSCTTPVGIERTVLFNKLHR